MSIFHCRMISVAVLAKVKLLLSTTNCKINKLLTTLFRIVLVCTFPCSTEPLPCPGQITSMLKEINVLTV